MRLVLITACLIAVALATPVPNSNRFRYTVRRPNSNAVSLHQAARQLQNRQSQLTVRLDDDSRESDIIAFRGQGNNLAAASAQFPTASRNQLNVRLDDDDDDDFDSRESNEFIISQIPKCPAGQLPHGNRCVVPRINRNIFVFGKDEPPAPKQIDPAFIPLPEIDYNIIFVRSRPEKQAPPVVIPPPQKKTVVYVLEDDEESAEELIRAPAHPDADPEVYYVKVKPGENPQLPGGIDLQTAYSQAIRPLQGIRDDSREDSLEITIGAGGLNNFNGGNVGVPLPNPNFNSGLQNNNNAPVGIPLPNPNNQGGAGFNNFNNVGIPLPSGGNQGVGGLGEVGIPLSSAASQVGGGFGNVGAPLPNDANQNGRFGDLGVPLPAFNGQNQPGLGEDAGFDIGFQPISDSLGFGNTARNLEVEIDDGRLEIDTESREVIQQALRYNVPRTV